MNRTRREMWEESGQARLKSKGTEIEAINENVMEATFECI
jgi:hypothetical protein